MYVYLGTTELPCDTPKREISYAVIHWNNIISLWCKAKKAAELFQIGHLLIENNEEEKPHPFVYFIHLVPPYWSPLN